MDDLYADKADSEQNDAWAEVYAGSSKGNTENFVNGSEEILKHLTNTVKELTRPGSTLNSLMTSVKTLEQEVRALKRHNTSDEGVMSQKEARLDNSEGNAMEAQEETSGAKSSLDDIDSFFEEEDTEEQPEEVPDSDLLEDLDQYFVPKTETGEDISDKLASVVNRILREGPDEKKMQGIKRPVQETGKPGQFANSTHRQHIMAGTRSADPSCGLTASERYGEFNNMHGAGA